LQGESGEQSSQGEAFASSYNKAPNEILLDSGFGGGIAVGAGRPRRFATATSHRALGDQVSSTVSHSTSSG